MIAFVAHAASGAVTIHYGFEDSLAPSITGEPHADAISAGDFGISSGTILFLSGTSGSGSTIAHAGSWSTEEAFNDSARYWEFSVTINEGYALDVTSLSFELGRTNAGPTLAAIQYSLNNFATPGTTILQDFAITSTGANALDTSSIGDDLLPAGMISDSIAFRIWGYNAPSTGNFRINDVVLTGNVSAVPEPGTVAAWCGLIGALAAARRIRRKAPRNELVDQD